MDHIMNFPEHISLSIPRLEQETINKLSKAITKQQADSTVTFEQKRQKDTGMSLMAHVRISYALITSAFFHALIALKQLGVSTAELDQISFEDITIESMVIPYMVPCGTFALTSRLFNDLLHHGTLAQIEVKTGPGNYLFRRSASATEMSPEGSDENNVNDSLMIRANRDLNSSAIKLEVYLPAAYLRMHELDTPNAWKTAHESGLYKTLFKNVFHEVFHGNDNAFSYPKPTDLMLKQTGVEAMKALNKYLLGGAPSTALRFKPLQTDAQVKKALKELRTWILISIGIDIAVPWVEFCLLGVPNIARRTLYQGDYEPDKAASTAFCKANWPAQLEKLKRTYRGE
jgi:hypothetical protein